MSDLQKRIEQDLKKAILSGDKQKTSVLRGVKSAILNVEIAKGKRDVGLTEEEVTSILIKEVKSRLESAELYRKGNDEDRAQAELSEKAIIDEYLPEQLSDEEISEVVVEVISQFDNPTARDMGQIIGQSKQKLGSGADGARIASIVKEKLK